MTEPKVGKAMRGVIFSRSGEGKQSAAAARNGHQRGIKNGRAQDQDRDDPRRKQIRVFQTKLQAERGHQESQEHRAAIAHENFRRFEIPAEKASSGAEYGSGQYGYQCLAVEVSK